MHFGQVEGGRGRLGLENRRQAFTRLLALSLAVYTAEVVVDGLLALQVVLLTSQQAFFTTISGRRRILSLICFAIGASQALLLVRHPRLRLVQVLIYAVVTGH